MGNEQLIDRVFARLLAFYGDEWVRKWQSVSPADLKTVWLSEIDGFFRTPVLRQCIAYALANLPERAPNAVQFKNLCRQAPLPEQQALPAPKTDPEMVNALAQRAKSRFAENGKGDYVPRKWAHDLKKRHESGEKLKPYQIKAYQTALGVGV